MVGTRERTPRDASLHLLERTYSAARSSTSSRPARMPAMVGCTSTSETKPDALELVAAGVPRVVAAEADEVAAG